MWSIPMKPAALALAIGLAIALPAPMAAAEDASDMDFRGVAGVRVTASPLSPAAADCNLTAEPLVRDMQQHLTDKGLKAAANSDVVATITVLSSYEPNHGMCSSAVMLGTYKKASFFDRDAGWLRTGYVVVWQSGLVTLSPPEQHLAEVRDAARRLGTAMAEEWRKANLATTN
ncbi:hypothetical protein [Azospirillum sp. SYSU D00513]|uniref:hypothetical protein n=1 Tax=Azospirillum sp. SYSU D00513 TaxID=2812561 RepID=UPI001A963988|nr:hypothetical protein [Azospirillum sp. SYSU D00513]